MAQFPGRLKAETTDQSKKSSLTSVSSMDGVEGDEEYELKWAALERLPTYKRIRSALFDEGEGRKNSRVVNVRKLGAQEKRVFIDRLIKHIEDDNLQLLKKLRRRIDKVGVELPTVEVRYKNLSIEADCEIVHGKPLPTLWNTLKSMLSAVVPFLGSKQEARINIIRDVSGVIKPGRMTLLLGPPGCGKTTFLLALSGKLSHSLELTGYVSYNGYLLDEFVPQKTSAYISQYDLHIPEMTVRETLDFSARCQGTGSRTKVITEVIRREKEAGIMPDPDLDTYMKAISVEAAETESSLQTDYILKILGLDICADIIAGDPMRRGISGGQKKRLTTGEMIVGPTNALFMDEISNGLDSSTTFQIVSCLQHMVHITDATALISLLQPAPETFDLFDDVILMAEGKIVYHGPRAHVLEFFEDCGFKCPERKGAADFLQEVISKKDQEQYWSRAGQAYSYTSIDQFVGKFKEFHVGKKLHEELLNPFDKSKSHKDALSFNTYSLTKWKLFKACLMREFLLMKRNYFVYVFKSTHLLIVASVTMTVFLRTRMEIDLVNANYLMGSLFYALVILLVNGIPELSLTVSRLPVFFKQRELFFYPAWAYTIPAALLKVPLSLVEAFVWTFLTYYVIGYSPELGRFFRHFLLLFLLHLNSMSMFRCIASICQTAVASVVSGSICIMFLCLFGGFVIPKPSMPAWISWGFWLSPLTYAELGLNLNEFLAPRWQKRISKNMTIGTQVLQNRGLNYDGYFYWISIVALIGITILFNIIFTLALSFLNPPGRSRAVITAENYTKLKSKEVNGTSVELIDVPTAYPPKAPGRGRMVLPFKPLTVSFRNVEYFVDTPIEIRKRGFTDKKLQLLSDITGVFKPQVLTALMGVSGAGKTTLMDVLSGRKTGGYIEGEIRIGGYLKVQQTFERISGYCEQTDIHSPNVTVEESLVYSAWLRLPSSIDRKTRAEFVNEVLETIELNEIKDSLVGMAGVSGLSTEQRKRLTIAVELVANPSVIFMDEPTTGLDARAAAIVMRAVKNVVETGRTVVCTIHQPSIDIFESFDELVLMKTGGQLIYSGPLGQHSSLVIEYFEKIPGVPRIKNNYNPATWMLEVTSPSAEADIGVDFAKTYRSSTLFEENKKMVEQISSPLPSSQELHFPSRFARSGWEQLKACVWKHNLSYWRSPSYNLTRIFYVIATSFLVGTLFWKKGTKINTEQDLFTIFGAMYLGVVFTGINNCSTSLPIIVTERIVFYRERFAGMYSPWANSIAQVLVEIPYLFVEAVLYVIITYPMLGYHVTGLKVFWSFYGMFCNLLCYNTLGMLLVSLTPNVQFASILASLLYTMLNLFSGYIIPKSRIPKWWIWLYYTTPTSWVMNAMFTSQYGDIHTEISAFGERKNISTFIEDYFGYRHDFLGVVAVVLLIYPVIVACLFAYLIGKLNFQKR